VTDARPILIRGALLADGTHFDGERGDLLVSRGRIVEVGHVAAAPSDAEVIDGRDRLVIPGLVNAHTHSHLTLAKGLSRTWTLEMHQNAGAWVNAGREAEDLYTGALLGAAEMLRRGCTACYDMPLELPVPTPAGIERIARAYLEAGMRAVIAPLVADRTLWSSIPGLLDALPDELRATVTAVIATPAKRTLAAIEQVLAAWPYPRERIAPAIGPTIPLWCEDEFLTGCRDLARTHGAAVHTHLAESKVQAVAAARRYGRSLTAHLDALGLLGPRLTAAHGVWLDAEDIARLADRGASVAHNPGSNMRLGNGLAPVYEMLARGLNVGIGTDTCTCSDHLNMFETLRLATLASRLRGPDPGTWLEPRKALYMATEGGARALGLDHCGRLEAGWRADLVLLDLRSIGYVPLNDAVLQLVFQENGEGVESVIVDGRFVVRDRRLLTVDFDALVTRAQAAADRQRASSAERRRAFDAVEPLLGAFCIGLARQPFHVHRYLEPTVED
jgi:guanine deaminase